MRQVLINMFVFMSTGGILASADIYVTNWQFWGIIIAMSVVKINSSID